MQQQIRSLEAIVSQALASGVSERRIKLLLKNLAKETQHEVFRQKIRETVNDGCVSDTTRTTKRGAITEAEATLSEFTIAGALQSKVDAIRLRLAMR
jgi:hypothetical protein